MRKTFMFNMVTLDGFFEGADRSIDWHMMDAELNDFAIEQLKSLDLLLFGRVTYQLMASYWPTPEGVKDDPVVANLMNSTAKIVFSHSLRSVGWENTRLVTGSAADEVEWLKKQDGADIGIFGSAQLCASLLAAGLIDECRLVLNPVTIGTGHPLFKPEIGKINFELLRSRVFKSGNVLLYYRPLGR